MSHKILIVFAFLLSCQVNAGAADSVLAKSQPEPATQQAKADTSAQTIKAQATSGNWEPKDIVLAAGVVVTLLLGIAARV